MISITPEIDKTSRVPVYQQLFTYMKKQIESGVISENDRLPSIRQLAAYLLISKNTVEMVYQQLLAEGYIHSKPRSGLFVLPVERLPVPGHTAVAGAPPTREAQAPDKCTEAWIDFEYGDVELAHFPVKQWKRCLMDALDDLTNDVYGYGDRQGHAGLRTEIASYLYQSRGVLCGPEQIFLSAGTQQSISLLCQLLPLSPQVAMEEPGYHGVRVVLANHGREVMPIPLEHDGVSVDLLQASKARTIYVTPSHQFPIGTVMSVQKRVQLLQWAANNDGYILEDDYDSEFRYQGQPIPALKAMDTGDRVIYLGTFSKSFLPGARLSYFLLPQSLAHSFRTVMQAYSGSVSPTLQVAVYHFMEKGYFEGHVRKMRRLYQLRHKTLIRAIQEHLGNRVDIIGQKSGIHLLLNVYNRSSAELIELAARQGVKVYTPKIHWMDPEACPDSYILLGFASLSEEMIREGILRLGASWFPAQG
ncbi:MocR-like pyridoxine biosynthesis transcription factor PdxR [Paenibacillus aestuarii]|uniref:MocR-like pyridoxine biosynthesis transcription factor PdxR n=1 Tax=Paenibacillus aestuarii TaxID=516965 RepID=UPI0022E9F6B4|nr:PLP-dependent aminotransferase family protein [Paenibacillus aestuarii]